MRYYRIIYRRRPAVRAYNRPGVRRRACVAGGTLARPHRTRGAHVPTRARRAGHTTANLRAPRTHSAPCVAATSKTIQIKHSINCTSRGDNARRFITPSFIFVFISHLLMQLHSSSADCIIFYVVILVFIGFVRKWKWRQAMKWWVVAFIKYLIYFLLLPFCILSFLLTHLNLFTIYFGFRKKVIYW